jgi:hypothetical protein
MTATMWDNGDNMGQQIHGGNDRDQDWARTKTRMTTMMTPARNNSESRASSNGEDKDEKQDDNEGTATARTMRTTWDEAYTGREPWVSSTTQVAGQGNN